MWGFITWEESGAVVSALLDLGGRDCIPQLYATDILRSVVVQPCAKRSYRSLKATRASILFPQRDSRHALVIKITCQRWWMLHMYCFGLICEFWKPRKELASLWSVWNALQISSMAGSFQVPLQTRCLSYNPCFLSVLYSLISSINCTWVQALSPKQTTLVINEGSPWDLRQLFYYHSFVVC